MSRNQVITTCPNCSSSQLRYDEQFGKIVCEFCETTISLPPVEGAIVEHPLQEGLTMADFYVKVETKEKVFHCGNCGSERMLPEDQVTLTCPFCASESVNESATETRYIQPDGIGPFVISKEDAYTRFKTWLGKGWFVPDNLKKLASLEKLEGIYLPFWTFDAKTASDWSADIGRYYYETQYYRDANGNQQSRQVQKVRWRSGSGSHQWFFDDELVIASKGVTQSSATGVMPFDLEAVVPFAPHYMLGWEAELYNLDLKESFRVADGIMDTKIKQMIVRDLPGDTYRFLKIRTQKTGHKYKHLLLPCWVAAYQYKEKPYQFLINGQTGKVSGKKPLSPTKIALTVLLVAVIALVVFLAVEFGEEAGYF
ncbi:MAG: hypothetical protein AB8F95_09735 [Bacteroidia bacterium]